MREETFQLDCSDGAQLHVRAWLPPRVRGVVQIAHGAAEHGQRYARVAKALAEAGYAVYANDHRGHGLTVRSPDELGRLAETGGWDRCVADLAELNEHIRDRHAGAGVTLMGHSMGSFLAQQYLVEYGETLTALVLSGSTKLEALPGGASTDPVEESDPFAVMNAAFAPTRTPFDWLSRDPDEVDRYIADELCGFALSEATFAQMLAAAPRSYEPAKLAGIPVDLPIYLFAGDRDPVNAGLAGLEALIETYRSAGLSKVTWRFYPEGRHEMLNETNRDEVTADLIHWLDGVPCTDPQV
jgi:alpha-beta hydrolase superfamily lysophospholipase